MRYQHNYDVQAVNSYVFIVGLNFCSYDSRKQFRGTLHCHNKLSVRRLFFTQLPNEMENVFIFRTVTYFNQILWLLNNLIKLQLRLKKDKLWFYQCYEEKYQIL